MYRPCYICGKTLDNAWDDSTDLAYCCITCSTVLYHPPCPQCGNFHP